MKGTTVKTHTCPECGIVSECLGYWPTHRCDNCFCQWDNKGFIIVHGNNVDSELT